MARFTAGLGHIHFESRGSRADPRVLFIHGLGCQSVQWPDSLLDGIVSTGLCAVTFDNRDAGLSDGADARAPSVEALLAAQRGAGGFEPPYTLSDMARDAVDLLDHLGQGAAHVVGLSMGGMIGQRMAIEHPQRLFSLTSIMSSAGSPDAPAPAPEAAAALLGLLASYGPEASVAQTLATWRAFGGPHFDSQEVGIGRFARRAVQRAHRPEGTARQLAAILADGDRRQALGGVRTPTLVLHGSADPLVAPQAGRDTAEAIPEARYQEFENMGHDLPEPLIGDIVETIARHIHDVEVSR